MQIKYILLDEHGLPSLCHPRYNDKISAQLEADRINNEIIQRNKQIDEHPSTGRGSVFMNIKRKPCWKVKEIIIND